VRSYGKIYSAIWASADFRALSEDGQKLALYLLTSGHATMLGCYFLPDGYICEDIGWSSERVRDAMADCIAKNFVERDLTSRWVFVTRFMKWNQFENTKVAVGARNRFEAVPDVFKFKLAQAILEYCGKHLPAEHVQKYTEQKPFVMSDEYEQAVAASQSKALTVDAPAKPVKAKAKAIADGRTPAQKAATTKEANEEAKTSATWKAYSDAMAVRYTERPPRNAMISGVLSKLIDRIGREDAPAVAAFYVSHNNSYYINSGHAVNPLLRDAEKLQIEMRSGQKITQQSAREADRRQSSTGFLAQQLASQGEYEEPGGIVDMEQTR
jgi:hypothetical protein